MNLCFIIAYVGNIIDTVATLCLTHLGYVEANPLMRPLLNFPTLFVVVKMYMMTAILCHLWKYRADRIAIRLAAFAAALYGAISIYYCVWFIIIISSINIY